MEEETITKEDKEVMKEEDAETEEETE